jgi:hypothetical protein
MTSSNSASANGSGSLRSRHVHVGVFTQPLAGHVDHGRTHVEASDHGSVGAQRR